MAIFVAKNGQLQTLKGVFECKEMLREGVDYERYDWLKADIPPIGGDMMNLPISSKNFEFQRNFIQLMNSGYFTTEGYSYYISDYGATNDRRPSIWNRNRLSSAFVSSVNVGLGIHTIVANNSMVTISSNANTASLSWYGSPNSISFNNAKNANKNTIHLTSSIKVDEVVRYVPCKLLRSIPSTLDANGKARVAGECGMYDSVSGKFFGNVASTGSFTVTND